MKNKFSLNDTPTQSEKLTKEQRIQGLLKINEALKSDPEKHAEFMAILKEYAESKKDA